MVTFRNEGFKMYELSEYNENDKEQITKLWVNVCVDFITIFML